MIKSFTDINQSKMLAEILPIESADMWWLYITAQGKYIAMMHEEPDLHYLARMGSYGIKDAAIRCWSLAALLGVLPKGYSLGRRTNGKYYVCMTHIKHNISEFDNPVDACVVMIEKLHELNLL